MSATVNGAASTATVRPASRADLPDVARIYLAAFPDTVEQLHLETARPDAIVEIMRMPWVSEPEGFFVAEMNGRVVGYAICPAHANAIWRAAILRGPAWRLLWLWLTRRSGIGFRSAIQAIQDKAHFLRGGQKPGTECPARVLSIAVDPTAHGRGIGRRLLEAGLAYLRSTGGACVRLEVRPGNAPAKRLYESVGFRAVDTIHDTRGPWEVMLLKWKGSADEHP